MGDNIYDNKFEKLAEISEFLDCLSSSEIILLLLNKTLVKNITIYATFKLNHSGMPYKIKNSIPGNNDILKYCHIIDEIVSFLPTPSPLLNTFSIKFNATKHSFFVLSAGSDYFEHTRKGHEHNDRNAVDAIAEKLNINTYLIPLNIVSGHCKWENDINGRNTISHYVTCGYNNIKKDSIIEFLMFDDVPRIIKASILGEHDNDDDDYFNNDIFRKNEVERANHASVLHNNRIYIAGGDLKGRIQGSRSVVSYDLTSKRWRKESSMFKARTGSGFYLLCDKKSNTIYAVGGDVDSSGQHDVNSIEKLIIREKIRDDEESKEPLPLPESESDWCFVSELPSPRINFKACLIGKLKPKLFMFGGHSVNWISSSGLILNEETDEFQEELMSYEVYDIENDCFEKTRDIPPYFYQEISKNCVLYH